MNLNLALDHLAEAVAKVLSADAAAVLLLGEGGDRLTLAATYGFAPEEVQAHLALPLPPADEQAPLVLSEYASAVCAPIHHVEGRRAGFLCAYGHRPRQFTPDDRARLQALADLSGVILQALDEASSLAEIDAAKSRFIHVATHELRSPIATAQSLVRIVLKGYAGSLSEQQQEIISRIARRLDFLESLVNDLLDFAASKAPELEEEEGPVALNASVGRAALLLQPRAEEKGIDLTIQPCREELAIWATEESLDRIFTNLIGNAVKYTPPGGKVVISLGKLGDQGWVKVADTGIGIPADALPHLFEEFYRAPNARQFAVGTGLGLAIVKELVERYGGRIEVKSREGEGSTFTVTFPLWRPE
ncbi:MAG TPA: GAF domain-containing protein [Anaerolineales bacterium]|nr:GAF domain-containing protein [Anaerolineae bacterium]HIP87829.1 GAF domain-containing protein [Anaerolineales bacterium]